MRKLPVIILFILVSSGLSAQTLTRFSDEKTGKYGFKDVTGMIVVKPVYDIAGDFENEKYISVNIGGNEEDNSGGKWGAIDKKGKIVIPVKYDRVDYMGYDLFAVNIGDSRSGMDATIEGKFALFNAAGKPLTPFLYSRIDGFSEGMAGVETFNPKTKIQKCGYFDSTGKLTIPLKYDGMVYSFYNGYAVITLKDKNGMIDKTGKIIIPATYNKLSNLWEEGLVQANRNGKTGFLNIKNETVIPFEYDDTKCSGTEGLIAVNKGAKKDKPADYSSKGGKWGFIDLTGKEVIPLEYEEVYCFSKGKAQVKKDGKKITIDRGGNEIK